MERIDLTDVTFIIPIRIDTNERIRNLKTVLSYLNKYFDTNIIIGEESSISMVPGILLGSNLKFTYMHIKTDSPYIHRTKVLNIMTKASTTPIVANYDVDVLFKVQKYVTTASAIRQNIADVCFPYNGLFVNITDDILQNAINTLNIESLNENSGAVFNPKSVGGALFFNKQTYIEAGLENENFVSWGFEDNERVTRLYKLGYRISRADGCLFHMNHPTSSNSSNIKSPTYLQNQAEFLKVTNMSEGHLRNYVNGWTWTKT